MNKWKKINLVVLALSTFACLGVYYGREYICVSVDNCTSTFKRGYLNPLYTASAYLSVLFFLFLFLPVSYFKQWFVKGFSWLLPLSIIVILSVNPNSSGILQQNREEWVNILAVLLWLPVTLGVLILFRKKSK